MTCPSHLIRALIMRNYMLCNYMHTIQNLQVGDTVLPTNSKDGTEGIPVKISLLFDVELRIHIHLERKGYSQLCRFYLCCDMNVVLSAHSIRSHPRAWLALLILESILLSKDPSLMMILQYLKLFTFVSWVVSTVVL